MKRLPLSQLPNFPKAEYWELIFELGDTIEELTDKVADRDARLEAALAEISRLTAESDRPAIAPWKTLLVNAKSPFCLLWLRCSERP